MTWLNHVKELNRIMSDLSVFKNDGDETGIDTAFRLWKKTTLSIREKKKTIFLIGNGASASMASHVAADL